MSDYGDSDYEDEPMCGSDEAGYSSGEQDYVYSDDEAEAASPVAKSVKVRSEASRSDRTDGWLPRAAPRSRGPAAVVGWPPGRARLRAARAAAAAWHRARASLGPACRRHLRYPPRPSARPCPPCRRPS